MLNRGGLQINSEPTSVKDAGSAAVQVQRPSSKQWTDFRIQDHNGNFVHSPPNDPMDFDLASPNTASNTNNNQVRFSNPPAKKGGRKRDKNGQPNQ